MFSLECILGLANTQLACITLNEQCWIIYSAWNYTGSNNVEIRKVDTRACLVMAVANLDG